MHVASKELSRELYELSGFKWDDCEQYGYSGHGEKTPRYDLGYLLRKLPARQVGILEMPGYFEIAIRDYIAVGATREDAACKLCIELFKKGILKKE